MPRQSGAWRCQIEIRPKISHTTVEITSTANLFWWNTRVRARKDLLFYHEGVKAVFGLSMSRVATDPIINLSLSGSIWLSAEFAQPFGGHLGFFVPFWPLMEAGWRLYGVRDYGYSTKEVGLHEMFIVNFVLAGWYLLVIALATEIK